MWEEVCVCVCVWSRHITRAPAAGFIITSRHTLDITAGLTGMSSQGGRGKGEGVCKVGREKRDETWTEESVSTLENKKKKSRKYDTPIWSKSSESTNCALDEPLHVQFYFQEINFHCSVLLAKSNLKYIAIYLHRLYRRLHCNIMLRHCSTAYTNTHISLVEEHRKQDQSVSERGSQAITNSPD